MLFDARENCEAMLRWNEVAKAKLGCLVELEGFGSGMDNLWVRKVEKQGSLDQAEGRGQMIHNLSV